VAKKKPAWKIAALKEARESLIDLEDDGMKLEMLTDYHWRFKNWNIWPSSQLAMKAGVKRKWKQGEFIKFIKSLKESDDFWSKTKQKI